MTLTYVEVDIDRCTLAYGAAPCVAEIGVTGSKKCFNTARTCQDRANYDPEPHTVRFVVPTDYQPATPLAIPVIEAVNYRPTELRVAQDLGVRSSVTVQFKDFFTEDLAFGLDPYRADRAFDDPDWILHTGFWSDSGEWVDGAVWLDQFATFGTFWGKFIARNPYLQGRPFRLIFGEEGQAFGDMEVRHFVVDSYSGPSDRGFSLTAKDPLKLADNDRAQVPALSTGLLAAAIGAGAGTATIGPAPAADEYPAAGFVSVGEEIMAFTRSGTTLTLTRGQFGTDAQDHDEDDLIQLCKLYEIDPSDDDTGRASQIVGDLLAEAGVDPAFFDAADWLDADKAVIRRRFAALIARPVAVKELIGELCEQAGFTLWWDDLSQRIRFEPLGAAGPTVEIDDNLIEQGSFSSREEISRRLSQVWVYYGQRNPLLDSKDPSTYASATKTVDLNAESPEEYGSPAIRQVFSRWIERLDRGAADAISDRLLERFRDPPRRFRFTLHAATVKEYPLRAGDTFSLREFGLQSDEGLPAAVPAIVVSAERRWDRSVFDAEELRFTVRDPDAPFPFVISSDPVSQPATSGQRGINLYDLYVRTFGTPPADAEVEVVISAGVVVGSASNAVPAFDVGTGWPGGAAIEVINNGRIAGAGGDGGRWDDGPLPPTSGQLEGKPGGIAFKAERPVTLINNGVIAGGGGGGDAIFSVPVSVANGGGGAGRVWGEASGAGSGTLTTGGAGVISGPAVSGDGGGPGEDGYGAGGVPPPGVAGAGGAAGAAIDGIADVTLTDDGTILGPQV